MVWRLGRILGGIAISATGSTASIDLTEGVLGGLWGSSTETALRVFCSDLTADIGSTVGALRVLRLDLMAGTGSTVGALRVLCTDLTAAAGVLRAVCTGLTAGVGSTVGLLRGLCTALTTSSGARFFRDNRLEGTGTKSSSESSLACSLDSSIISSGGRSDNSWRNFECIKTFPYISLLLSEGSEV